ncbi:hypothetical protein B0A48_03444 [Cryoendolithus antarcticus]|uniref:Uncharacterized protein n=1 Tax=Cryoendolithus antarcticus TaxID=1507870 RepID=A0A1V8TK16_9PEZI|nr:hypothetical protein B0A48_03444 [Cryoendolithus antarcticus]
MAHKMPTAVEASSLSVITAQAANPPANLQGGSSNHYQQPLVLYVARVPGSRDVFLTPLKPREKVVTAQDVQSCLYYLHMNSANDRGLLNPQPAANSANTEATCLQSLQASGPQRKPVPPPRPIALAAELQGSNWSDPPRIARRAVPGQSTHDRGSLIKTSAPTANLLPSLPPRVRHPLPPTPPSDQDSEMRRSSLHAENVRLLRRASHSEQSNPYVHKYPEADLARVSPRSSLALGDESCVDPDIGSLTLIRRDPTVGEQWNVATIVDPLVEEVSSTTDLDSSIRRKVKRSGAPLLLDITNPGYLQFVAPPADRAKGRKSTSTTSTDDEPAPEGTFRRRLYMPGSKYADDHRYSHGNVSSLQVPRMQDERPPPIMDRRSKLYSFLSPWEGRCEFSTSAGGISLRCRHILPSSTGVLDVSELRFNLPSSSRSVPAVTSKAEKRGSYFSMHQRMRSEDSWGGAPSPRITPGADYDDAEGDESRLDLSLGQERAGGGFGGKKAKLGKLIIHPGGLAMLDLVVAANMGLWWRAWERLG